MNRQWGGVVDTTPDAFCPIIGLTPVENLYFNCGWGTGGSRQPLDQATYSLILLLTEHHIRLQSPFSIERFYSRCSY